MISVTLNNRELHVDERIGTYADLDRLVDALYHAGFLLWPKEIGTLAAGEDAGDRPGMMRTGADLAASNETAKSDTPAKAPEKPAGAPARAALPSPPARAESAAPGVGRGGRAAQPVTIGKITYPTKRAAIVALLKGGSASADIIRRVGTTAEGYKTAVKLARKLGELRQ